MILFQLFYEFFITGLLIFGGGLAAVPFLKQMAERTGWFTVEQLADIIAVSEATPGPIGINMATYAGFKAAGVPGGLTATFGLVLPSVIIALVVARFLVKFKDSDLVESLFYGLRPASLALIAAAGISVMQLALMRAGAAGEAGTAGTAGAAGAAGAGLFRPDFVAVALAAVLFVLTNLFKKVHPAVFLAGSAAAGVVLFCS